MNVLHRRSLLRWVAAGLPPALLAQQQTDFLEDLSTYAGLEQRLPDELKRRAHQLLAHRKEAIAKLRTPEDVTHRRVYIRQAIETAIGGLPERTPLNARSVGEIRQDGYTIEKIIFESQPNFFVTANLYLPARGSGPYPGILYPLGHERGGKSHDTWQRMLANLARQGYVALAWDPLGQGERAQMWDEDFRRRKLIRSTTEHTMLGVSCLLNGDNVARYTIWDGIRALDYLVSRPEVDDSRIACTGNSGGGTHTSYLSALDDRIHVAAPSCYLTGWGKLLDTIGPQDAEQVLLPWIGAGLDHADFAIAFAPKPFLILSAIRDFFSIVGARDTFAEVRALYERLGVPEKIAMNEVDAGHGYHQPNRVRAYQWFAHWLKNEEYEGGEDDTEILSFEDLACTQTGQVATSLGGETVSTLNRARAGSFDRDTDAAVQQAKKLCRWRERPAPQGVEPYGTITRDGYRIEKLLYRADPGVPIPALLFVPDGAQSAPAIVFADGAGKSAQAEPGGAIESLVQMGAVVLALDPRGMGETNRIDPRNGSDFPRYFGDYNAAMTAFLLADNLAGMRATDIAAGVGLLDAQPEVDSATISLIGRGEAAVPALFAAAFDERIRKIVLDGMLVSYSAIVDERIHIDQLESVLVGALREFDLPDIAAALAPRPVSLVDLTDPRGQPIRLEEAQAAYARANRANVIRRQPEAPIVDAYRPLLV